MHKMDADLSGLDMRVLRFLRLLLRTGSVTRTAAYMGISQPAASRTLARIRNLIGDPILVRTQTGYQLTDHALTLRAPADAAIRAVGNVFAPATFDPSISDYCYRIASTDYGVAAVLGPIMEVFADSAPTLRVDVSTLVPGSFDELENGSIDLLLYAGTQVQEDLITKKLFDETYALLFRQGHPLQQVAQHKSHLTPQDVAAYRQIEFNYPGVVELKKDTIMRSEQGDARAVFHQPYFMTLPLLIGSSDAVAAVPARLGEYARRSGALYSAPFQKGEGFSYHLVRHERSRHNLAINWFVKQAVSAVGGH